MKCYEDRMPVDGQFTREYNQEIAREGDVFPDLTDTQFPDRSPINSKKRSDKIEIYFDDILVQVIQQNKLQMLTNDLGSTELQTSVIKV